MNGSEQFLSIMENKIFNEMMGYYKKHAKQCTGFSPSCSLRTSWAAMPRILVLTHYPHPHKRELQDEQEAQDKHVSQHRITCLWPDGFQNANRNAIFVTDNWENKSFHERLLLILAEIANCTTRTGKGYIPSLTDNNLETFVDSHMVVASFVPFRNASDDKAWISEREQFAKEQFWGPIFEIWQPEVIIALGNRPFYGAVDTLKSWLSLARHGEGPESVNVSQYPTADVHGPCKGTFRSWSCPLRSGRTIHLLGIPSPAAPGHYGYPSKTASAAARAPVQDFLKERLKPLL